MEKFVEVDIKFRAELNQGTNVAEKVKEMLSGGRGQLIYTSIKVIKGKEKLRNETENA